MIRVHRRLLVEMACYNIPSYLFRYRCTVVATVGSESVIAVVAVPFFYCEQLVNVRKLQGTSQRITYPRFDWFVW